MENRRLEFSLTEEDYLLHQLFVSSKSTRINYNRKRSWIVLTLALGILAFVFYRNGEKALMYYFSVLSVLCLFLYPMYLASYYKKHYRKFIVEHFKSRFNQDTTLSFTPSTIETTDISGELKINYAALEEISETADHIYLRLETGGSLIIPKKQIDDCAALVSFLKELALTWNLNYSEELNWRWK